jgi:phosphoglycolate phosphatase
VSAARPAALVFDLDGTLVDSRRDIATTVNRLRGEAGLPPLTLDEVVAIVGEGAPLLVRRVLGPDVPQAEIDGPAGALARYLEIYREVCLDTTRPYPGITELLPELAARYPLALLSNKGESLSRLLLERLDLAAPFREVLGGDTLPTRKPDPAGLALAAARLGFAVEEVALIGDMRIDAETAANAGSFFGLAEWGFSGPVLLEGVKADWRLAAPVDLRAAFLGG